MRTLLLLLVVLLNANAGFAQAAPRPTSSDSVVSTAPVSDTVAAIHRLFAAKRARNTPFIIGTLGVGAIGGVVIGTAPSGWDGLGQNVLGAALIALVSLPALVVEAMTALDYNKKSERQAVEDFQAHKVPRYLKRKLKPRYFQEPPPVAPNRR